MTLEKLKEHVDKISALLNDPQPGLMSWNEFLDENLKAIIKGYYETGTKSKS